MAEARVTSPAEASTTTPEKEKTSDPVVTTENPSENVSNESSEEADKVTPAPATTEPATTDEKTTEPKPVALEDVVAQPDGSKPDETPKEEKEKVEPKAESKGPLDQLFSKLPSILEEASHHEMWGVELKDADDVPTVNVLTKFLRANNLNVDGAASQLLKALKFRKELQPLELLKGEFNQRKFAGLGYITIYGETVFTWNIYGACKNINETFGNVDEFIKWRVALMELAIQTLNLSAATEKVPLTLTGDKRDNYQMIQVHDYKNISFLRPSSAIRASSKKTIEVFSMAYPELLREKYFVNVPAIMGWMFAAMKLFVSKETIRKFHPISNGTNLAKEFGYSAELPSLYGGKGEGLDKTGKEVILVDIAPAEPKEEPKEDKKESEPEPTPAGDAVEAAKKEPEPEVTEEKKVAPAEEAKPSEVANVAA
ncbi:MAG: Non-classical phosphatidylinositol transfer protein (PITP) [Cirrosporium novae-zelandiae]|nr:MAG: Non-classical phosphatidylinositol transfer protein (PITP) [Cirrosporium novae-zelandiae]